MPHTAISSLQDWLSHWWAWFTASSAPADLVLIAGILLTGLLWPKPKPKAPAPPCFCDGYNGVVCPHHADRP